MQPFPLTKTNRLKLAQAFNDLPRVDLGIDCAIEGQMGSVLVDQTDQPTLFILQQPPFLYIAGDVNSLAGQNYLRQLPIYYLVMVTSLGWPEAAKTLYQHRWVDFPRYYCSSASLSAAHIEQLIQSAACAHQIKPIDLLTAESIFALQDYFIDLSLFDNAIDFIERGFGYVFIDKNEIKGGAYTSLICSKGIEVSIFVEEDYRRQGIATTLAAFLIKESLSRGLDPHWDAANPESILLAKKLGYQFSGEYTAYYLTE